MIIESEKRLYQMPEPLPGNDELIIYVEEYAIFQSPESSKDSRFNFSDAISKFIFFFIHEGPRLTLNKVFATLLYKKVINERRLVIAYGLCETEQEYFICLGPQDCPGASKQAFRRECCIQADDHYTFASVKQTIAAHMAMHPRDRDHLFYYSRYSGIALDFNLKKALKNSSSVSIDPHPCISGTLAKEVTGSKILQPKSRNTSSMHSLFMAGAGAYVYAYILPYIKGVMKHTIIDLNPVLAARAGHKHNFMHWETSCDKAFAMLQECKRPILIIATYHTTHYEILDAALAYNPETRVLLEKPPVTSVQQLKQLIHKRQEGYDIEIGFNRRYSPMIQDAKKRLGGKSGPVAMTCIVKELKLPLTHWYYWPSQGTRITGNLCHWIDLGTLFIDAVPVSACIGQAVSSPPGDEISIVISYEDGSRLTLMSTDSGNSLRGVQEYIDIRQEDITISIDDFLSMRVQQGGKSRTRRTVTRDKGHKRMYREYMKRVSNGEPSNYSDRDLYITSMLYLSIVEAVLDGRTNVDLNLLSHDFKLISNSE